MGFQARKRTKGIAGWLNFSFSQRRGLGASASLKLADNVTYNTRGRLTINLGSGMKYVFYKKKQRQTKSTPNAQRNSTHLLAEHDRLNSACRPVVFYKQVVAPQFDHDLHLKQIQDLLVAIRGLKGLKKSDDFEALSNLNRTVVRMKADGRSRYDIPSVNAAAKRFEAYSKRTEMPELEEAATAIRILLESLLGDSGQ